MVFNLFQSVTAAGFKPATPTSVVWYSIQLSYAAVILFSECKDRAIFQISKGKKTKNEFQVSNFKFQDS